VLYPSRRAHVAKGSIAVPGYLKRPQAAAYLTEKGFPITKGTLQKMATTGGGPDYKIFGNHALYEPPTLDAWAAGKLRAPAPRTTGSTAAKK
jgi:hypothetical protein